MAGNVATAGTEAAAGGGGATGGGGAAGGGGAEGGDNANTSEMTKAERRRQRKKENKRCVHVRRAAWSIATPLFSHSPPPSISALLSVVLLRAFCFPCALSFRANEIVFFFIRDCTH